MKKSRNMLKLLENAALTTSVLVKAFLGGGKDREVYTNREAYRCVFKYVFIRNKVLYIKLLIMPSISGHGSSVYVSFLNCNKGLDRVSQDILFLKLLERNVTGDHGIRGVGFFSVAF